MSLKRQILTPQRDLWIIFDVLNFFITYMLSNHQISEVLSLNHLLNTLVTSSLAIWMLKDSLIYFSIPSDTGQTSCFKNKFCWIIEISCVPPHLAPSCLSTLSPAAERNLLSSRPSFFSVLNVQAYACSVFLLDFHSCMRWKYLFLPFDHILNHYPRFSWSLPLAQGYP